MRRPGESSAGSAQHLRSLRRGAPLSVDEERARQNRAALDERGIVCVNLMGAPGSGKTALLEVVARRLGRTRRLGVLASDVATELDAERLSWAGVPSRTIATGSAHHLDAELVARALEHFEGWEALDYLFVENVGCLVCPADHDLGQTANVVALSVTDGEDEPLKYPEVFRRADLVLITKVDLLLYLPGVRAEAFRSNLARVSPVSSIPVSATSGTGVARFEEWLEGLRAEVPRDSGPA